MINTTGSNLQSLIDLAHEPSSEKRRDLLRSITDIFMVSSQTINPHEMSLYDDVMCKLSEEMELRVRAEISERLAKVKAAPRQLIRKLAFDDIAVAKPVLTHSNILEEEDLIELAKTKSQEHLRAISKRDVVSEKVTGVIVTRGDVVTLGTLLNNDGAAFSRQSNEEVYQRSINEPSLQQAIIDRQKFPPDLLGNMVFIVEAKLKEKLFERLGDEAKILDEHERDKLLADSRDQISVFYGTYPADYIKISKEVELKIAQNSLDAACLARYMRDKNQTYFLCSLAHLANIDYLTAKDLTQRREFDAIAIAFKAAKIEKALFLTYLLVSLGTDKEVMGKATHYGELYEALPIDVALRTIRFWKLRRLEAKAA